MFAIIFLVLMSFTIDCHSICETITPNGFFNGLQIYRKYESYSVSHLVMNNRNGIEWQFNITSDGQYSHKMDDSMATTDPDSLQRFGCVAFDYSRPQRVTYQNCMTFAAPNSSSILKCKPNDVIGDSKLKRDDYVIVPKPHTTDVFKLSSVFFFNPKTKVNEYIYESNQTQLNQCDPRKFCGSIPPPFVEEMDNTLFRSIEGVVDFKSSDGKTNYFILFKIDGRPKFCVTSADGHISSKCNSSEELTNLFKECFESSHTSNSILFWVLIVVALLVVVIVIVFVIVFLRRRRSEEITDFSSFRMVSSNPTILKST